MQVLFYCHYPDLLLARRGSRLRAMYRTPLDWAEQSSTGAADVILVNSEFTRGKRGASLQGLAQECHGMEGVCIGP